MADSNINIELRVIGDSPGDVPTVGRKLDGVRPGTTLAGAGAGVVSTAAVGSPIPQTLPSKSVVAPIPAPAPTVPKPAMIVPVSDGGGIAGPKPPPPVPPQRPVAPPIVPPPQPPPTPRPALTPPAPPAGQFLSGAATRSVAPPAGWTDKVKTFPALALGLVQRSAKALGTSFNVRETGNTFTTGMLAARSLQRVGTAALRGGIYGAAIVYGGKAMESMAESTYEAEREGSSFLAARGVAIGRGLAKAGQFAGSVALDVGQWALAWTTSPIGLLFDAKGAHDAAKQRTALFDLARAKLSGSEEEIAAARDDYRAATGEIAFDEGEKKMRSQLVVDDAGNVTYAQPEYIHARFRKQVDAVLARRTAEIKKALTAHRVQVAMESFHAWGSWTPHNPVTTQFTDTAAMVNRQYERVFIRHYEGQLRADENRDFDFANERAE